MVVTFEDRGYTDPVVAELVAVLQAEYVVRYGGPDETPVDAHEFDLPDGVFVVMRVDGAAVGCGGLRRSTVAGGPADVELKRMYVRADRRGRGLSRILLRELESRAVSLGAARIVLETGTAQPEAMGLYESAGYERIPGFGFYCGGDENRCYAKTLT